MPCSRHLSHGVKKKKYWPSFRFSLKAGRIVSVGNRRKTVQSGSAIVSHANFHLRFEGFALSSYQYTVLYS
jgi:hypothetical protein